jgi:sigma-B regulation protein RsbU (phosphoserine phosphatase)
VNAGHPAAVVVADDGNTTTLDATGSAVGWTSDAHFADRTIAFSAGDVVAIYSDGISEAAAPDGRDFGVEGVARTLRRHRSSHSSEIITALCAEVDRFTVGAAASDDRTVLVAKVDR